VFSVKDYVFYLQDDRRDARTVRRARVRTYEEAWNLAERMLRETYHHLSVEVWTNGEQVLTIRTGAAEAAA
jgi:hypothetical protein